MRIKRFELLDAAKIARSLRNRLLQLTKTKTQQNDSKHNEKSTHRERIHRERIK